MKYKSILQTIGNTPIVELKRYSTKQVKILAKLEGINPGGSIKDRIALFMILDARRRGLLSGQKEIIEPTSGNTGIGLAMLSAIYGYQFTAVLPESVSVERRKILSSYGANIILTDGEKGTNYAIEVTRELIKIHHHRYVMLDQFNNPSIILANYETTGKEIVRDVPMVTHFVAGMGTGGTLMGVGKRLKEYKSSVQIIGVEPKPYSTIQGLRNMQAYTPSIFDESKLDLKLSISDDQMAFNLAREVLKYEGISVGISSGAALWGALEISKTIKKGVIVVLFPDKGDRYVSTSLFQ